MSGSHAMLNNVFGVLAVVAALTVSPSAAEIPIVEFESVSSTVSETAGSAFVTVALRGTSPDAVTVKVAVVGGSAYGEDGVHGSGKDYVLVDSAVTFPPGETNQVIEVRIVDDDVNESDETIELELRDPDSARLGAGRHHTITIVDNDRANLVSVRDFGATGDGETDDTDAIQQAVDTTFGKGGGVLVFPPGVYIVTSVLLRDGITYQGFGATIKRPSYQGKWTRTFTTTYSGDVDSKPLIIKGLLFDGNSGSQGPFRGFELEQAQLVFLVGDRRRAGRLRAVVEDCVFKNGVASAMFVYVNVDATIYRNEATDMFRGGICMTGGHSIVRAYDFVGLEGTLGLGAGFHIEVDGPGYSCRSKSPPSESACAAAGWPSV
jgi:hypothetical protein